MFDGFLLNDSKILLFEEEERECSMWENRQDDSFTRSPGE